MHRTMVLILFSSFFMLTAACSARHSLAPTQPELAESPSPFSDDYVHTRPTKRQCKGMKFQVDRYRSRGALIRCHGAEFKEASGELEDWIVEGEKPVVAEVFKPILQNGLIRLRFADIPDGPVRLRAYAPIPMPGSDELEILKEVSLDAAELLTWRPELPEGRYLISAYVHWPNICTERFIGVEVLP
jgi:hypothetical protein